MKAVTVIKIVIAVLVLSPIVGLSVLREMHTFRASVSGRVTDNLGAPVANAKVKFIMPNTDSLEYDCETKTGSDGRYSIALPSFKVALDSSPNYRRSIRISAEGYVSFSKSVRLDKGHNSDTDITLVKAADDPAD